MRRTIDELEFDIAELEQQIELLNQQLDNSEEITEETVELRRLAQACLDDARQVGSTYLGQLTTVQTIIEALEHGAIEFRKVK